MFLNIVSESLVKENFVILLRRIFYALRLSHLVNERDPGSKTHREIFQWLWILLSAAQ